jgi:hypothetical protein
MMIKHDDPREGTVTLTVTQVTRTEPDAALFEIPEGFKPARAVGESNHRVRWFLIPTSPALP